MFPARGRSNSLQLQRVKLLSVRHRRRHRGATALRTTARRRQTTRCQPVLFLGPCSRLSAVVAVGVTSAARNRRWPPRISLDRSRRWRSVGVTYSAASRHCYRRLPSAPSGQLRRRCHRHRRGDNIAVIALPDSTHSSMNAGAGRRSAPWNRCSSRSSTTAGCPEIPAGDQTLRHLLQRVDWLCSLVEMTVLPIMTLPAPDDARPR